MCIGVNRWKAILSVLCLAIWLPATQHCRLENIPGLTFLRCATDTPGASDCEGDACQSIEHGAYKAPDNGDFTTITAVAQFLPLDDALLADSENRSATMALVSDPPRLQPESWQSYSPRALPIRGPSCFS